MRLSVGASAAPWLHVYSCVRTPALASLGPEALVVWGPCPSLCLVTQVCTPSCVRVCECLRGSVQQAAGKGPAHRSQDADHVWLSAPTAGRARCGYPWCSSRPQISPLPRVLSSAAIPRVGLASPPPPNPGPSCLPWLPVPAGGSVPQKTLTPAQSLPPTGPSPAFRAQGENLPRILASAALGSVTVPVLPPLLPISLPLVLPTILCFPPSVSLALFLPLCLHPPVPPGFRVCHVNPHSFIPPPSHLLLPDLSLRPTLSISLALGPESSP